MAELESDVQPVEKETRFWILKKYRQLLNYFNFDLKTVFRDCSGHAWRSRVNQKSPYWTANR